ncbi:MAG: RrF2 family transcriptional regulator [Planctomycetota bacterium]
MISQTTEYALRAVVSLGYRPTAPMTTQQIAEMTQVPVNYLSKVLQLLVRAGILSSQRGINGGFTLVKRPADLTLWDVVNATEPIRRIECCPLAIPGHAHGLCALHKRLDQVIALIEQKYRETTIAQLLNDPDAAPPLCDWPRGLESARPPQVQP